MEDDSPAETVLFPAIIAEKKTEEAYVQPHAQAALYSAAG